MEKTEEISFGARVSGGFPPDLSSLLGLGFQRVSSSSRAAVVRRVEGTDLLGRPHLFSEITIRREGASLRYSCPEGQSPEVRRLQSCILLLRVLSIIPRLEADAAGLGRALLPALESASSTAGSSYSLLHRKYSLLEEEASSLRQRNTALTRACGEGAATALERERRISALESRVASLEAVPDHALRELLLDWLSSHHGAFSASSFSQQHRIPPSRAEEGLGMLLKSGGIRRAGQKFAVQRQPDLPEFEVAKGGVAGFAARISRLGAKE